MGNKLTNKEEDNSLVFSKEELEVLYHNFVDLDTTEAGFLNYDDIINIPELSKNPLIRKVLRIFDLNDDGKISFFEFVIGLSTFADNCTDKYEKLEFIFKIYDSDEDGYISNGDLFKTIKLLIGNNLTNNQLQQIVDRTIVLVDKDLDGKISLDEFVEFIENNEINEFFSISLFL